MKTIESKWLLTIVIAMTLLSCSSNDPIKSLVGQLSSNPHWPGGEIHPFSIPPHAKESVLITQAFKYTKDGQPQKLRIIKHSEVIIRGLRFSASHVATDLGERVVLLRYVDQVGLCVGYVYEWDVKTRSWRDR
jgi:hypothetical protein